MAVISDKQNKRTKSYMVPCKWMFSKSDAFRTSFCTTWYATVKDIFTLWLVTCQ